MSLEKIRFVLVEPSHPGNIGAVARSLKNMGLSALTLVNPKRFPDTEASERAAGALDVLEQAHVVATVDEALEGASLILATSSRRRGIANVVCTPREALERIKEHLAFVDAPNIVFLMGPERTGLLNEDMDRAHIHINIPANPEYPSLNLAQAVQLLSYECQLALGVELEGKIARESTAEEHPLEALAPFEMVNRFHEHLEKTLTDIEFIKPTNPHLIKSRLRKLFAKASLTQREVQILRGILSAIDALK